MLNTSVMRLSGKTYRLDLTVVASTTLLIEDTTNDQTNLVSLLNTGTGVASVEIANASASVLTPTIASTENAGSYVLPAAMHGPILIAAPPAPFYIKGISSSTNSLFITPVEVG